MKCAIKTCESNFAVILETHLPVKQLPHLICDNCWRQMALPLDERRRAGNRCEKKAGDEAGL